jgi:hypothetical protein
VADRFVVIFEANVLYPYNMRDVFFAWVGQGCFVDVGRTLFSTSGPVILLQKSPIFMRTFSNSLRD